MSPNTQIPCRGIAGPLQRRGSCPPCPVALSVRECFDTVSQGTLIYIKPKIMAVLPKNILNLILNSICKQTLVNRQILINVLNSKARRQLFVMHFLCNSY